MHTEWQIPENRVGFCGSCASISVRDPQAWGASSDLLPDQRKVNTTPNLGKIWKDPLCFLILFFFQDNHKLLYHVVPRDSVFASQIP